MHRALAHFRLGTMNLITAIFLFVFFSFAWLVLLPQGLPAVDPYLGVRNSTFCLCTRNSVWRNIIGPHFSDFDIPYLRMEPVLPSAQIWWLTVPSHLLIFVATYFLPQRLIPVIYLLRGVLLVQAIALLYFAFSRPFPAHPGQLFGRVRNVWNRIDLDGASVIRFDLLHFRFGLLKKALLTSMTMVHLALFLPFQVLLQALVLQKTVLFMPVLYIIFGMPVDVLLVIGFYSWGMTWSFRSEGA